MKKIHIKIGKYEILLNEHAFLAGKHSIVTNLHTDNISEENRAYNSAVDGLESLILAHYCNGINVNSPAYIKGIEAAVNALSTIL